MTSNLMYDYNSICLISQSITVRLTRILVTCELENAVKSTLQESNVNSETADSSKILVDSNKIASHRQRNTLKLHLKDNENRNKSKNKQING